MQEWVKFGNGIGVTLKNASQRLGMPKAADIAKARTRNPERQALEAEHKPWS